MRYKVYALIRNKECVYVGFSSNVKNRVSSHRSKKKFDDYIIISTHQSREDALLAERSIIKFLSIFGSKNICNALYSELHIKAQTKGIAPKTMDV